MPNEHKNMEECAICQVEKRGRNKKLSSQEKKNKNNHYYIAKIIRNDKGERCLNIIRRKNQFIHKQIIFSSISCFIIKCNVVFQRL